MIITLNKLEAEFVIESLACYANQHRQIANDDKAGYPPESRQAQLAIAVRAHDLATEIDQQIKENILLEEKRAMQPAKIDPYDAEGWSPNDPRNW